MPSRPLEEEARGLYTRMVRAAGTDRSDVILRHLRHQLALRFKVEDTSAGYRLAEVPTKLESRILEALRRGRDDFT
jgi:hypothetical protein